MKIKLKEIAAREGVDSLEHLAAEIGCTAATLYRFANSRTERFDLAILERLCCRLKCTPNDLLEPECESIGPRVKPNKRRQVEPPAGNGQAEPAKAGAKGAHGRAGK